ncbi:hypothetical protein [Jiella marina]|uniref:hypothetical protein n=1 Tax=Jiella sp. LLJ827 TaxID=2917712 RepID=UPI0021012D77|nr:hypothetical protein [Jiella sp. LLJ827]MCQ0990347.1 hypothetical protein [Jiella sp. LLJ827]
MKILKETFFERLRNRLPANDARRAIKAFRRAKHRLDIDYMTVKELSELRERYRTSAMLACRAVKEWEVRHAVRRMQDVYRDRERQILYAQAREAVSIYRDIKQDYVDFYEIAMHQVGVPGRGQPSKGVWYPPQCDRNGL